MTCSKCVTELCIHTTGVCGASASPLDGRRFVPSPHPHQAVSHQGHEVTPNSAVGFLFFIFFACLFVKLPKFAERENDNATVWLPLSRAHPCPPHPSLFSCVSAGSRRSCIWARRRAWRRATCTESFRRIAPRRWGRSCSGEGLPCADTMRIFLLIFFFFFGHLTRHALRPFADAGIRK